MRLLYIAFFSLLFMMISFLHSQSYAAVDIQSEINILREQMAQIAQRLNQLEAMQNHKKIPPSSQSQELQSSSSQASIDPNTPITQTQITPSPKGFKGTTPRLYDEKPLSQISTTEIDGTKLQTTIDPGKTGLTVKAKEKDYELSLRGVMQFDAHYFAGDKFGKAKDEMFFRRLRPTFAGRFEDLSFKFTPDFAGETARIMDIQADYRFSDALNLRIGKFKPPVGFERVQSGNNTAFNERGLPTNIVPDRDTGIMAYGTVLNDKVEYEFGMFNGGADGQSVFRDADSYKDFMAHLSVAPWEDDKNSLLKGFGVGAFGSVGKHKGTKNNTILANYKTAGQQEFFVYDENSHADGLHWHFYPYSYLTHENMGILAEYALTKQRVRNGGFEDDMTYKAWQVVGSYVLTGEASDFEASIIPKENFTLEGDGIGAWEIVTRVGGMKIGSNSFTHFANLDKSSPSVLNYGAGINWYLNPSIKLMGNYTYSDIEDNILGQEFPDEHAIFTRAQLVF